MLRRVRRRLFDATVDDQAIVDIIPPNIVIANPTTPVPLYDLTIFTQTIINIQLVQYRRR